MVQVNVSDKFIICHIAELLGEYSDSCTATLKEVHVPNYMYMAETQYIQIPYLGPVIAFMGSHCTRTHSTMIS